jgi:hypothetical protein
LGLSFTSCAGCQECRGECRAWSVRFRHRGAHAHMVAQACVLLTCPDCALYVPELVAARCWQAHPTTRSRCSNGSGRQEWRGSPASRRGAGPAGDGVRPARVRHRGERIQLLYAPDVVVHPQPRHAPRAVPHSPVDAQQQQSPLRHGPAARHPRAGSPCLRSRQGRGYLHTPLHRPNLHRPNLLCFVFLSSFRAFQSVSPSL